MAAPAAPVFVNHVSDLKFSVRIRSHEFFIDQTIAGGGNDSAPGPLELLGASLGGCIAYYMYQFLHSRGLSTDGLQVTVVPRRADNPSRIESFAVSVNLPLDIPERYRPMLDRLINQCPAYNTLSMGAKIGVTFTCPAEELVGA